MNRLPNPLIRKNETQQLVFFSKEIKIIMTNQQIQAIAMQQSACDSNCLASDFLCTENKVVISAHHPQARKYLDLPFLCDFTSYGHNIVASVSEKLKVLTEEYLARYSVEHCFETPNLHMFMENLRPFECNVCFMAEYFLPDADLLAPRKCDYHTELLFPDDCSSLYLPEWSNALSVKRPLDDCLAVGAYDHGKLIGLAACSADCETMWQIGIDVLPEYRMRGIGTALTSQLAAECLNRKIVPFYCSAWSNLSSVRNALRCGFRPASIQLTVKTNDVIAHMNRI